MRCIFCRMDSTASRSREHVIPESLGNKSIVLPKGVVCDKCNNYFSREVERPFLESPAIRTLRFNQGLESKKGRVPSIPGLVMPDIPAVVTRFPRHDFTSVAVSPEALEVLARSEKGTLIMPLGGRAPDGQVVSRFMAKVAMEAMAARVIRLEGGQEYICDESQFDTLREHARYGRLSNWPVHTRTIYHANARTSISGGPWEQVIHESDFLVTSWSEWFFVLAIFGLELTINVGGPDIEGYERWLRENDQISPLYRPDKPHPYPRPGSADS
jgi:hypothetical protein